MKWCNTRRRYTLGHSARVFVAFSLKSRMFSNSGIEQKCASEMCKFITLCDETKIDLEKTFGSQKWMQPHAYQMSAENMQNACDFIYIDLSSAQRMAAQRTTCLAGRVDYANEWNKMWLWVTHGAEVNQYTNRWTPAVRWRFYADVTVQDVWGQAFMKTKTTTKIVSIHFHSYSLPWCSTLVLSNPMCAITAEAYAFRCSWRQANEWMAVVSYCN